MSASPDPSGQSLQLLHAARQVLTPLVRLMLAHGVKYNQLQELLKSVMVEVASEDIARSQAMRAQSRISVATGLRRPEVKRLLEEPITPHSKGRSVMADVFGRWTADRRYRDARGRIKPLARLSSVGGEESFEALVRSIKKDVHPRSVFEDMQRLGLIALDKQGRVKLIQSAFTPKQDLAQMLNFLGANVGSHLETAVHNTLGLSPDLLEQSMLGEGLSDRAVAQVEARAREEWRRLFRELGDLMMQTMKQDKAEGISGDRQMRIGMYSSNTVWVDEEKAPTPSTSSA
ncbi:MAG: hypothetical protein EAZ37_10310 [Burkholderiales bacterium]|nr:MAG: hypothetical protein EAZ37_10310 [Burkholderiales bacterium]